MGACNSAAAAAPVSLDIYWDVENCGCARTAKGAAEMHARLMDFITGAAGALMAEKVGTCNFTLVSSNYYSIHFENQIKFISKFRQFVSLRF